MSGYLTLENTLGLSIAFKNPCACHIRLIRQRRVDVFGLSAVEFVLFGGRALAALVTLGGLGVEFEPEFFLGRDEQVGGVACVTHL